MKQSCCQALPVMNQAVSYRMLGDNLGVNSASVLCSCRPKAKAAATPGYVARPDGSFQVTRKEARPAYIAPNVPKKKAESIKDAAPPAFIRVFITPSCTFCFLWWHLSRFQVVSQQLAVLHPTVVVVQSAMQAAQSHTVLMLAMPIADCALGANRLKTRSLPPISRGPCLMQSRSLFKSALLLQQTARNQLCRCVSYAVDCLSQIHACAELTYIGCGLLLLMQCLFSEKSLSVALPACILLHPLSVLLPRARRT